MELHTTTSMLREAARGNREAFDQLIAHLGKELLKLAGEKLRSERNGHTLDPSALVSEFYLKEVKRGRVTAKDRKHYLAHASLSMRQILVDHARGRAAMSRSYHLRVHVPDLDLLGEETSLVDILILEDLFHHLDHRDALAGEVVMLRVYGGLSLTEIASLEEIANHPGLKKEGEPPLDPKVIYSRVKAKWASALRKLRELMR